MAEVYIERLFINVDEEPEPDADEDTDSDEDIEFDFPPSYDFNVFIFGRGVFTTYTNSESFVNAWVFALIYNPNCEPTSSKKYWRRIRELVIGLDIQLVDDWNDNEEHPSPVATVQLCVNDRVLVYHMYNATRLPFMLELLLTDPNNIFVGIDLEYKLRVLRFWGEYEGRVEYRNVRFVAALRYNRPGLLAVDLRELAVFVLGQGWVMPEVHWDWDYHTLADNQIMYASLCAYVSYEMGRVLLI